jgi:hypothetical protein
MNEPTPYPSIVAQGSEESSESLSLTTIRAHPHIPGIVVSGAEIGRPGSIGPSYEGNQQPRHEEWNTYDAPPGHSPQLDLQREIVHLRAAVDQLRQRQDDMDPLPSYA